MLRRSLACAVFGLLAGCLAAAAQGTQQPTTSCSAVFPYCAECSLGAQGTQISCVSCVAHSAFKNGACTACDTIDPACTTCANGACTACADPDSGTTAGGAGCAACSAMVANCEKCANGLCSSCKEGYGVGEGGAMCAACSTIEAHCTTCAKGTCTGCIKGYAVNRAGQCLEPGTPSCKLNVGGQCCRCPPGKSFNHLTGNCVGAAYGQRCTLDSRQ